MKKTLFTLLLALATSLQLWAVTDNADTLVVAADGSARFSTLFDALEDCRAFMDYHKVILVKQGIYREKVTVPSWLTNIEILGEDRDNTIITYNDYATLPMAGTHHTLSTFRTATVKVDGSRITFKNITIANTAGRVGQALALHTEGDELQFINCKLLGNQDTVYTGVAGTRIYFKDCYIEGTTDFIFGPSTAWFEHCTIHSLVDSYITAASTPQAYAYGYVFSHCHLTHAPEVEAVYLGRPWRSYGATIYIYCEMESHILPAGWHNWNNPANEQTARYAEFGCTGPGADTANRVAWAAQLTPEEAAQITPQKVFEMQNSWLPE